MARVSSYRLTQSRSASSRRSDAARPPNLGEGSNENLQGVQEFRHHAAELEAVLDAVDAQLVEAVVALEHRAGAVEVAVDLAVVARGRPRLAGAGSGDALLDVGALGERADDRQLLIFVRLPPDFADQLLDLLGAQARAAGQLGGRQEGRLVLHGPEDEDRGRGEPARIGR